MSMLRAWAVPVRQGWARGISSVVQNGGSCLPPAQLSTLVPDSGRGFSCAFPTSGSHPLRVPQNSFASLYALHSQAVSKATVPRDPERPKRPLSAFFRFGAQAREKQGLKQASQIGQAWANLSPAEKQPFLEATAAEVAVYREKFDAYKASGKLDAHKRDPAKPKKPLTAFFSWAMDARKQPNISSLAAAEASKALGVSWKSVSSDVKAPLQAKFETEMVEYNAKMKEYKDSGKETAWLASTGRLEVIKKAEAKRQAQKDAIGAAKEKKKAKDAQAKEKSKAATDKEKDKIRVKRQRMLAQKEKGKEAAAKAQEKAKAAKETAKKRADAKKAKDKLALSKKRAASGTQKKAGEKQKAQAALSKMKAKAATEKKRAQDAMTKQKAKEALVKKRATAKAASEKKKAKAALQKGKAKTSKAKAATSKRA